MWCEDNWKPIGLKASETDRLLVITSSWYDIEFTLDTKVECTRQCFYKQLEEFTKEPESDETNE